MKKILLCITFSLLFILSINAKVHTVARGETLESIALAYNIPYSQLLAANPGADNLFFVGLKLNIPDNVSPSPAVSQQVETTKEGVNDNSQGVMNTQMTATVENQQISEDEKAGPGWDFLVLMGYGFLPKPEGLKSYDGFSYNFEVGGTYWLKEVSSGLFAGVGLGFLAKYESGKVETDYSKTESNSDIKFISIPLKLGYAFATQSKKLALTPYLGLDMGITVSGKNEINKERHKVKSGKLAPLFKVGAAIRIFGFNLGAFYSIPVGKKAESFFGEDGFFGVNIAYGL